MNDAMAEYYKQFGRWLHEEFIPTVTAHRQTEQEFMAEIEKRRQWSRRNTEQSLWTWRPRAEDAR